MKTTFLMAAVLAVATILAAGLTVLPSPVQEAQANPCSLSTEGTSGDVEDGSGTGGGAVTGTVTHSGDQNCDFTGPVEFDED